METINEMRAALRETPKDKKLKATAVLNSTEKLIRKRMEALDNLRKIDNKKSKLKTEYFEAVQGILNGTGAGLAPKLANETEFFSQGELGIIANSKVKGNMLNWYNVFRAMQPVSMFLLNKDRKVIDSLANIKIISELKSDNFQLNFSFYKNSYFKNTDVAVNLEFGKKGKCTRVTSNMIDWENSVKDKYYSDDSFSFFKLFLNLQRTSPNQGALYNIDNVANAFLCIKKYLLKYAIPLSINIRVPQIRAINEQFNRFTEPDEHIETMNLKIQKSLEEEREESKVSY